MRQGQGRGRAFAVACVGVTLFWLIVYLTTVSPTVNFIDSGELITAAYEPGIAHPPGYPLYIIMAFLVSHLLWGEVAWRVNVISSFWGACAVGVNFLLICEILAYTQRPAGKIEAAIVTPRKSPRLQKVAPAQPSGKSIGDTGLSWLHLACAASGASLLAASATFWSRTAQAKMYTLHFFFVSLLLLLALKYRQAYDGGNERSARRWLTALTVATGLSFTNHMMTLLLLPGIAVLLLFGTDWRGRLAALLRRWPLVLLGLLPLALYAYLPLRSAQHPIMNWGSPDTWGDFWRHITGWQYRAYFLVEPGRSLSIIARYASTQWSLLTVPVLLAALASGYLLFKLSRPVALALSLTTLITVLFSVAYNISEIEPYMVPLYIMLVTCVSGLPVYLRKLSPGTQASTHRGREAVMAPAMVAAMGLVALVSAVLQYPRQNLSNDRLAEQFALNAFNSIEPNSIVLTDYWDFDAPTYYLQNVRGVRPDLTIVDMSSLKYPWHAEQLEKLHPWLMQNSRDIANTFETEQRRWVNGEAYDVGVLDESYWGLLTSFVERNYGQHPAYIVSLPCNPNRSPEDCPMARIAPQYYREHKGIVDKLWKQPPPKEQLPPEPAYKLAGITDNFVPMDEFALLNSQQYVNAYVTLANLYSNAGKQDAMQRMIDKANEVRVALHGR